MKRALLEQVSMQLCQVVAPGGEFPVAAGLIWMDCEDDVTPETHIFDGTNFVLKPIVPPLTADQLEAQCQNALNAGGDINLLKLIKAKMISDEAFRLGVAPVALTGAQLTDIRNRIADIYKAL